MRIVSGSLISPANFSTLWLGLAPLIPHGFSMVRSTQRCSTGLQPDTPRGHGVVDNFSMIIVGHLGLLQAYSIHHPTRDDVVRPRDAHNVVNTGCDTWPLFLDQLLKNRVQRCSRIDYLRIESPSGEYAPYIVMPRGAVYFASATLPVFNTPDGSKHRISASSRAHVRCSTPHGTTTHSPGPISTM